MKWTNMTNLYQSKNPPKLLLLNPTKCENLAATNCSKDLKRKMSLSEDDKSKSGEVKIL